MQKNDIGNLVPIGFGSQCLNTNEHDLLVNYIEALAVVEAYAGFYILIQGKPLTIYCDNKPITENANEKFGRIYTHIQALKSVSKCEIIHIYRCNPAHSSGLLVAIQIP